MRALSAKNRAALAVAISGFHWRERSGGRVRLEDDKDTCVHDWVHGTAFIYDNREVTWLLL